MSKIILSKSIQELMSKEAMGKTTASVSVSAFSQGPEVYTGIVITGYSITARNGGGVYPPKDFDLVGWNDSASDWDILDSIRGESFANTEKRYYDVMVPKTYKKFRINILSGNSASYVNIGDLQFYNLDVPLVPNLTGGVITGQTSTLNGYTVSASSSWNSTYLAWKAFNGTVSSVEDTWNSASGKVAGEWLEIDFGNNLDNYARMPYVIISQGKQLIPITGSTNTVAVTQSGLQLAQDIAINNTSNTSITHLVFEYTDKFNTKIGYSILPLATPIKSSEKVTFTQPVIPFNTIPNSSSDFELASYYSYTQPVFKDDIILSTSRHALKSFFRNMVDVNTPHTFQTNLIVADNLSGAFGDNRDSLLTSDFTTVPSVNLITMAGVDDTDDLRDTDLTQDKKIFRSKFMNRNFMYVKDHGFYGIKVELDSSVDVSGIQVITQEMNGFTIKLINVTSGYNVYVASTAEPIIRIEGSNIFIYSATKADDLMVAVGDALGELAPFVDRMQELKNVYQNQTAHGDIITKSYTVMIDSTQHVLTTESGVYKSPYGDIPTQILEYNGDTYVQIYNRISPASITHADYIDSNLNVKLFDSLIPITDNKIDYIAFRQFKTEMGTVTIVNGKATTPIIEELDDLELSVVFAKVHESQILKGNYSSIVDWRSVSLTNNDIGLYHYNTGEYISVLDLSVDGTDYKTNDIFYNKNDDYQTALSSTTTGTYFNGSSWVDIAPNASGQFVLDGDFEISFKAISRVFSGRNTVFELATYNDGILFRPSLVDGSDGMWVLGVRPSRLLFSINKYKEHTENTVSIKRVAGVFTLEINGEVIFTSTTTTGIINPSNSAIRIGASRHTGGQIMTGYVRNFKIVNKGVVVLDVLNNGNLVDASSYSLPLTTNGSVSKSLMVDVNQPIAIGNPAQGYFTKYSKEAGKWSNYFDGVNGSFIPLNSTYPTTGTGVFTIEVDVFCTKNGGNTILGTTSSNAPIGISEYGVFVGYQSNWAVFSSTTSLLNRWVKLVIGRDASGNITVKANGVLLSGSLNSAFDWGFNKIGWYNNQNGWSFGGYISNLKITKAGTVVLDTCKDNRFKDNSVYNHTLTPTGNVKVSPFSPYQNSSGYDPKVYGGSGYFENNRYLSIPHSSDFDVAGQDFEIEADVYPTSYANHNAILTKRVQDSTSNCYFLYIHKTNGTISFYNGVEYKSTAKVPLNTWSNVKCTYVGGMIRLYLNGVLVYTSPSAVTIVNNTAPAWIGYGAYSTDHFFNGYMSNLRMTKNGTEILKMDFDNANIIDGTYGANISEVNATANTTNGIEFAGTASGGSGLTLYPTDNMIYNARTGQFRISCEVNPKIYNFIIFGRSEWGSDNDDINVWCDSNGMVNIWFGSLSLTYKSTIPLNLNQWNDVIVERSESGLLAIIINGQVGYMSTITASTVMNATVNWTVGSDNANDELRLNGSIRSLKVEL